MSDSTLRLEFYIALNPAHRVISRASLFFLANRWSISPSRHACHPMKGTSVVLRSFFLAAALFVSGLRAELINIAHSDFGGFAEGSTVIGTFPNPQEVNDGNRLGLASTGFEVNPWWQVTFADTYRISVLNLFYDNRACCLTRMNTFSAFLYDSNNVIVWSSLGNSVSPDPNDNVVSFTGMNVLANRVRFQLETTNNFGIREIEAYADLASTSSDVPEPATLFQVASVLLALWAFARFRRQVS